jgi:hypothetical protein
LTQQKDRWANHFLDCRDARHRRLGGGSAISERLFAVSVRGSVSSPLSLSVLMSPFWQKGGYRADLRG